MSPSYWNGTRAIVLMMFGNDNPGRSWDANIDNTAGVRPSNFSCLIYS